MKHTIALLSIAFLLSACSGDGKKVLVMASGKVQVSGNVIKLSPGTQHNEETMVPDGETITVQSPDGEKTYDVKENGLYLLNLKKDTLSGSYQRIGASGQADMNISQQELRSHIDSLARLAMGFNVSPEARNYNIPPREIARITDNANAQVIGPYKTMPTQFDPSKEHEVYKFYTNKEMWDNIYRLVKMVEGVRR